MQLVWAVVVGLVFFGLGCDRWFVEAPSEHGKGTPRNSSQKSAK